MADGRADLAVHSLKNLPTDVAPGFTIAGITAREDPRDAFVSKRYASLDAHARRRGDRHVEPAPRRAVARALSRARRSSRCAATSTRACASSTAGAATRSSSRPSSLKRAGFASRISGAARARRKPARAGPGRARDRVPQRPPRARRRARAACRPRDHARHHRGARVLARARRHAARRRSPAYAEWEEGALWLRGLLASADGGEVLRGERDAEVDDVEGAEQLGRDLADDFLARGAGATARAP